MITYDLSLERQNLLGADKFSIAADSNETVSLRFHFDRSWRIFDTKAAVFKSSHGKYYVLDIHSNSVTVPWEVLRDTGGFDLAVVAYENEVVMTSKKVRIAVSASLLPEFCRQLSPTETIFDRFRTEARNEAFLDYKDEIAQLKHTHANEVLDLNEQIAEERSNTEAVRAQKDAEIAQLNYEATVAANAHNAEVAALEAQIAEKTEKAHNWDLVDEAFSKKTTFSAQLWTGGTEPFELPTININSVQLTSSTRISPYLTKFCFRIQSLTNITDMCAERTSLLEAGFKDSEGLLTANTTFNGCTSLRKVDMGNLTSVTSLKQTFYNCRSLEKVILGNVNSVQNLYQTFYCCYALKEIIGTINANYCTDFSSLFYNCGSLEEVRFANNCIKKNIDFTYCVNLSKDSIYSIANGLDNAFPATVTFARHAFSTNLTEAQRAEVTDIVREEKGWTLSIA